MPKIVEYTNEVTGLRPTETGVNALSGAARRVQSGFNEQAEAVTATGNRMAKAIGGGIEALGEQVVKHVDHQQVAAGSAYGTKLFNDLTEEKDNIIKGIDPKDPAYGPKVETAIKKWREEKLEPALEQFKDGFTTENSQKWADHFVSTTRQHMFVSSAADVSTAAGIGIKNAIHETINTASNTATRDPSSVQSQLDLLDHSVTGMVATSPVRGVAGAALRSEVLDKGSKDIVVAGAIGAIAKSSDPERTAQEWGEKYSKYINPAELKMLSSNARQQIRADRQDQAYSQHIKKGQEQDRSDATETGILQKLYSDDPKDKQSVSSKSVVNNPDLTRTAKERTLNLINREMKPETDTRVSARTSVDIIRAMRDPNADPQKVEDMIFEARTKDPGAPGSLTKADMADLQKQLVDRKTPQGMALAQDRAEFFKRFAATIDPSMGDVSSMQFGHHSALGQTKMYEADKAARRMEDDLKRQGKDPHGLYDPSSPDFFGKPANIMKYRASLQESQKYQADMAKTGPVETVTGVQVIDLPKGMTPAEASKNYKSGTKIRLPDGRTGTVP